MHLRGREAAAGWSWPTASCLHIARNCRSVIGLVQVPKPARYFQHEKQSLDSRNAVHKSYQIQSKRRIALLCLPASTGNSSPGSPPFSSPSLQNLDPEEIELRIKRAANFITTSEKLVPFDPSSTNLALIIWQAIQDIPADHRPQLLNKLSSG